MSDFYFANVALEPNPVDTSADYEIKIGIQERVLGLEDGDGNVMIGSDGKGIWVGEIAPVIEDGNGIIMIDTDGAGIWAGQNIYLFEDGNGNLIEDGFGNIIQIPRV